MAIRRPVGDSQRGTPSPGPCKLIWLKTAGHCHFCGDQLDDDHWQADHVVPRMRAGNDDVSNLLPICPECNKLRSAKSPAGIRKRFRLGVYAWPALRDEKGDLGKLLRALIERKDSTNALKRKRRKSRNIRT